MADGWEEDLTTFYTFSLHQSPSPSAYAHFLLPQGAIRHLLPWPRCLVTVALLHYPFYCPLPEVERRQGEDKREPVEMVAAACQGGGSSGSTSRCLTEEEATLLHTPHSFTLESPMQQ